MPKYTNPEMRKAVTKLKEAPRPIKIGSGSSSVREPFETSQRRSGSMTQSGLPRTSTSDNKRVGKLYGPIGGRTR